MNAVIKQCDRDIAKKYLKPEWLERLSNTRFLTRCRTGEITKEELHIFLQQHQLHAKFFTRYLAALLSNIESHDDRFALSQNLFDEMGLGDAGNIPHSKLYQNMMDTLGVAADQVSLPTTQHLVNDMLKCCKSSNHMVGLGALCLGAEGIVSAIYQMIVAGFLSIGESIDNLLYFTMHIECDDDHALTMYDMIERNIQENPSALIDLNYGAEKIIQARIAFFEGLLA